MAKKEIFRGFGRIFIDEDRGAETEITIDHEPKEDTGEATVSETSEPVTTAGGNVDQPQPPTPVTTVGEAQQEESAMDAAVKAIAEKLDAVDEALKETKHKDELIRNLHKEMENLKNDFYASLRRPAIKSIVGIHRRMEERLKHLENKCDEAESAPQVLFAETLKNMRFDCTSVLDTLEDEYDLVYFVPIMGDAYNPKEENAVKVEETDNPALGGTIKDVVYGGYKDACTGRVWLKANIVVYRLKQ